MKINKAKLKELIKEEIDKELQKIDERGSRAFGSDKNAGAEFTVSTKQQAPTRDSGPIDDAWYLQFSNVDARVEKCLGPYGDSAAGRFNCPSFVKKRPVPSEEEAKFYDAGGFFDDDIYDRHDAYLRNKERAVKAKDARRKEDEKLAKSIALQKKILTLDPVKVMKSKVNVCKKMRGKCGGAKIGLWSKLFGASTDERRDAFWCDYCREKFCSGYECDKFIKYLTKLELDAERKSFMKARAELEKEREAAGLGKIVNETAAGLPSFTFSQNAVDLIKDSEGFRSKPYLDGKGNPTIGYGTTIYPNRKKVTLKDKPITKAQAEKYLAYAMGYVIQGINKFMATEKKVDKKGNPIILNQNQIDALVSLGYNIGRGALLRSKAYSTATRRPNDPRIKKYFMEWVSEPGHVKRRKAEIKLYFTPV